jgi:hypothetical protein
MAAQVEPQRSTRVDKISLHSIEVEQLDPIDGSPQAIPSDRMLL